MMELLLVRLTLEARQVMLLKLNQLIVPIGHQLLIKNISWSGYKNILAELGEYLGQDIKIFWQNWVKIAILVYLTVKECWKSWLHYQSMR